MDTNEQTQLTIEQQNAIAVKAMSERAIEAGKYDLTASKDSKDASAAKQSAYYMLAVAARQGQGLVVSEVLANLLAAVKAGTVRRSFYETGVKAVKVGESTVEFNEKSGFSNLYNKNSLGGALSPKEQESKAGGAYRKAHGMAMKDWNRLTNAEQAAAIIEGQAILDGDKAESETLVLTRENVHVFAAQIVAEYGHDIAAALMTAIGDELLKSEKVEAVAA